MHPYHVNVNQLEASQIEEITQFLALAFENGSGLSQICKAKDEELRRRLRFLFRTELAMQASANQLVLSVTEEAWVKGAAVIQEPDTHFPLWTQIWGLLRVSLGVSPAVAWDIWQNVKILKRYHPLEPHYYLLHLGVHPDFQGKGYARALLDELHARSEAHPLSTGVYAETANPHNLAFYKHFGYHIMTQVNIKGVKTFVMFRKNSLK